MLAQHTRQIIQTTEMSFTLCHYQSQNVSLHDVYTFTQEHACLSFYVAFFLCLPFVLLYQPDTESTSLCQ